MTLNSSLGPQGPEEVECLLTGLQHVGVQPASSKMPYLIELEVTNYLPQSTHSEASFKKEAHGSEGVYHSEYTTGKY